MEKIPQYLILFYFIYVFGKIKIEWMFGKKIQKTHFKVFYEAKKISENTFRNIYSKTKRKIWDIKETWGEKSNF
jgi:hypothetical protein